jgi:hypothetical protein
MAARILSSFFSMRRCAMDNRPTSALSVDSSLVVNVPAMPPIAGWPGMASLVTAFTTSPADAPGMVAPKFCNHMLTGPSVPHASHWRPVSLRLTRCAVGRMRTSGPPHAHATRPRTCEEEEVTVGYCSFSKLMGVSPSNSPFRALSVFCSVSTRCG